MDTRPNILQQLSGSGWTDWSKNPAVLKIARISSKAGEIF